LEIYPKSLLVNVFLDCKSPGEKKALEFGTVVFMVKQIITILQLH